ncbi:ornithine carbamoyltransferase [Dissophora globulifera]|uniref:ornithine carbamoyltransferase n=1 Tax=Dissophora globulifera TaxID=979702 RepID=A0A9P6UZ56_9FUNG|nr:ornithine carbamoyltransferase [Dissophora globulifera]
MIKNLARLSSAARVQAPSSSISSSAAPAILARSFSASTRDSKSHKTYTTADVSAVSGVPHLLTDNDLSSKQLSDVIRMACKFKHQAKVLGKPSGAPLAGKTMALMFSKRSTRTRVATESAVTYLGGHAMFLGSQDIQLGVNESLLDTSKVVSSMVDGIMARVGAHSEIETLAKYSTVPIINALSDLYHPTQILADLMTLHELYTPKGSDPHSVSPTTTLKNLRMAWVGDGNNILHSLMLQLPKVGMHISMATPKGYEPNADILKQAQKNATDAGTEIGVFHDPKEALRGADIVVTDTWISMGQEEEKKQRIKAFAGYQLTTELITESGAQPDWKFLHCLPRKQEEVTDDVFYSPRSHVFQEAENRKWTILACINQLLVEKGF